MNGRPQLFPSFPPFISFRCILIPFFISFNVPPSFCHLKIPLYSPGLEAPLCPLSPTLVPPECPVTTPYSMKVLRYIGEQVSQTSTPPPPPPPAPLAPSLTGTWSETQNACFPAGLTARGQVWRYSGSPCTYLRWTSSPVYLPPGAGRKSTCARLHMLVWDLYPVTPGGLVPLAITFGRGRLCRHDGGNPDSVTSSFLWPPHTRGTASPCCGQGIMGQCELQTGRRHLPQVLPA